MEHRHPRFSNKLMVMLGTAIADLLRENGAPLAKLIKAYDLPHAAESQIEWMLPRDKMGPEEYVEWVFEHEGGLSAARLIETIHEEVKGPNPAVFTETRKTTTPGPHHVTTLFPPSFFGLIRQLEIEGYTFRSNKLVPIDPDAPQEFKDKTELAARVRSHAELDPKMLIYHMDQSNSAIDIEDWKSAAGAARHFFEGLVINISVCAAQLRKGVPPVLPEKAQRPNFGQARADLLRDSFTKPKEDKLIGALYGFQSEEGGHYGITKDQMANLTRRFCWVLAAHLLTKYESQSGAAD